MLTNVLGEKMKPLKLHLLRHGVAEDKAASKNDSDRRLTAAGKKKIRQLAKALKKNGAKFDLILTSPYLRAKETAEIVARVLYLQNRLKICPLLAADGNPKALVDELNHAHARRRRILLVGHEPYLSRLISLLLSGETGISLTLKKGGWCKLSISHLRYGRCATLENLLSPRQIAALK